MNRTKKIFVWGALVFAVLLTYASYDISRRTTFPGSKPQLKERLQESFSTDTLKTDSARQTIYPAQ